MPLRDSLIDIEFEFENVSHDRARSLANQGIYEPVRDAVVGTFWWVLRRRDFHRHVGLEDGLCVRP